MAAPYFSPKDPREIISYSFDFTALLSVGETFSAAFTSIAFYSGPDPTDVSILLVGSPLISNNVVSQLVSGGVSMNTYELTVSLETTLGQTLYLCGLVPVIGC